MKTLYFITGWMFVALGAIGAVLPVLPTTPFILLALWAFAKSSPRFHDWLYHHKWFGPAIQRWQKYRIIPLHSKVVALSMMSLSLIYILIFSNYHYLLQLSCVLIIGYGAYFISNTPSKIPSN